MSDEPHGHSGEHGHTSGLSEADATAAITNAGYSDVTNMVSHGHSWHADATDAAGAAVAVVVDGHGGVHLDQPDTPEPPEPPEPAA